MTATVEGVKAVLFGLDVTKLPEVSITAAIGTVSRKLTYLRKTDATDALFDDAVTQQVAYLIASRFITSSGIGTLGYSRSGRDTYLKNLQDEANDAVRIVVSDTGSYTVTGDDTSEFLEDD